MSTKTFMVGVAAVVVLLGLPLIVQTVKSIPGHRVEHASQSIPMEEATAVPATAVPIQPALSQPAALRHTYDVPQNPQPAIVATSLPEPVPAITEPVPPAPPRPSVMTRMQFNQVNSGMTYEQCVRFIGCEGEPAGPSGAGGEQFAWQLVDSPSSTAVSGEATLSFQNGILNGKGFNSNRGKRGSYESILSSVTPAQRPASPPYICRPVYDGLKDDCSYQECVRLLGVDGSYLGSRPMSGGTRAADGTRIPAIAEVYIWHNPAIQATLTLFFRDGRLTGREMSGGRMAAGGSGG